MGEFIRFMDVWWVFSQTFFTPPQKISVHSFSFVSCLGNFLWDIDLHMRRQIRLYLCLSTMYFHAWTITRKRGLLKQQKTSKVQLLYLITKKMVNFQNDTTIFANLYLFHFKRKFGMSKSYVLSNMYLQKLPCANLNGIYIFMHGITWEVNIGSLVNRTLKNSHYLSEKKCFYLILLISTDYDEVLTIIMKRVTRKFKVLTDSTKAKSFEYAKKNVLKGSWKSHTVEKYFKEGHLKQKTNLSIEKRKGDPYGQWQKFSKNSLKCQNKFEKERVCVWKMHKKGLNIS